MLIPDEAGFEAVGYEYKVQIWDKYANPPKWTNTSTNRFDRDVWYPNTASANNALAQHRASRWGRINDREYRLIKRPYGEVEVVG